jgi:hypothetical protein
MCDQGGGKRERENDVENDEEERDTVGQVPAGATTSTKKRKSNGVYHSWAWCLRIIM